jgi:hypothetical protein
MQFGILPLQVTAEHLYADCETATAAAKLKFKNLKFKIKN